MPKTQTSLTGWWVALALLVVLYVLIRPGPEPLQGSDLAAISGPQKIEGAEGLIELRSGTSLREQRPLPRKRAVLAGFRLNSWQDPAAIRRASLTYLDKEQKPIGNPVEDTFVARGPQGELMILFVTERPPNNWYHIEASLWYDASAPDHGRAVFLIAHDYWQAPWLADWVGPLHLGDGRPVHPWPFPGDQVKGFMVQSPEGVY